MSVITLLDWTGEADDVDHLPRQGADHAEPGGDGGGVYGAALPGGVGGGYHSGQTD